MKKALRWIWIPVLFLLGLIAALILRDRKASLIAGALLAALGLTLWAGHAVNRNVAAEPAFALASAPVSLEELPVWMDGGILSELHRSHIAPLKASALDRDAAAVVGQALAASPWVREVSDVTLDTTPRISVKLAFREPVARVAWGTGQGWVDADGVLLPRGHYRLGDAGESMPLIVGVRGMPPKAAGSHWNDAGLTAGLAVLARFRSEESLKGNPSAGLQSIDVGNVGERRGDQPEIVCVTHQHLALRFSMSGMNGKPGRPTLDEQIGRLHQVLDVDRNLTLAHHYVDLRFPRPVGS